MPTVKTIVRENVVSAPPDAPIADVARMMDDEKVGSVVIVEEDRPQGIVTDRDVAIGVVARDRDPETVTAADVMHEDLVTVDADAEMYDVMRTMNESKVRRLPAVDSDGRLAGIVTFDDFVALLGRELKLLGEVAESEAPPYEET